MLQNNMCFLLKLQNYTFCTLEVLYKVNFRIKWRTGIFTAEQHTLVFLWWLWTINFRTFVQIYAEGMNGLYSSTSSHRSAGIEHLFWFVIHFVEMLQRTGLMEKFRVDVYREMSGIRLKHTQIFQFSRYYQVCLPDCWRWFCRWVKEFQRHFHRSTFEMYFYR